MKKAALLFLGILLLLNISYCYTFTVDDGRSKLVNEVKSGNTVFVGLEDAEEVRFVVKEGDISLTEVSGKTGVRQFIMPSENVWVTLIRPGDIKIITATAGANGTISPSGRTPVTSGTNQTFEMIPNAGYAVDYVMVDGVNVGDVTSYTFSDVTDFHTISVAFKQNTFEVTLDQQSGSGGSTSVIATYGFAMPAITKPSRTGYTFGGYYTGTNGSGTQYYNADGSSARNYDIAATTTLYAKWTANTYTVTLNNQSATTAGSTSVTATYESAMPAITKPSKTGYTFGGYYTGTNGSGTQYYNASGSSVRNYDKTAAMTLYAKWTANKYTVTLNQQSGSGGTTSVTATYGSGMPAITVPTRTNYIFAGYYTGTNGSGTQYYSATGAGTRNWNISSNTTLYAKWNAATVKSFSYTGGMQSYTIPTTGIYKLEVWGAGGGSVVTAPGSSSTSSGGAGGYSIGYKIFNAGTVVYIGVGGSGNNTQYKGGYNGGGDSDNAGAGGGATHIATQSGVLSSLSGATGKVLIVAGGGGGAGQARTGGAGGGSNGRDSETKGGTQTTGGTGWQVTAHDTDAAVRTGSFGKGGQGRGWVAWDYGAGGGGGGGWYGGGGGASIMGGGTAGAGGSGYIGGVPQFTYNGTTYSPSSSAGAGAAAGGNGSAKISLVGYAGTIVTPRDFGYTGGIQSYSVPTTGLYKLEVWGAGGSNGIGTSFGGTGGYSVGYKVLNAGTNLYVCVGGSSGYNGGATSNIAAGGGATHIATQSGVLSSLSSAQGKVLIVAGGGGGAGQAINGGAGGGSSGDGIGEVKGGSQTAGGAGAYGSSAGSFGTGGAGTGNVVSGGTAQGAGGGGGGGWYGGGGGYPILGGGQGGAGGSGYVGGVPQVTYNGTTYSPSTVKGGGFGSGVSGFARITFVQ